MGDRLGALAVEDLPGRVSPHHRPAPRASQSYPTVVGTLDAIHLTSALAVHGRRNRRIDEFLTHDGQLGTAARAVGFAVRGVADGEVTS